MLQLQKYNLYDIIIEVRKAFKTLNSGRAIFGMMIVICCILVGAVLKLAAAVFLPFTIAVLLAFVMYPMVAFLGKYKIPQAVSILIVIAILGSVLGVFGMVLVSAGSNILAIYPRYEYRLTEIYIWAAEFFDLPYDASLTFWENLWGQFGIRSWIRGFAFSFSNILLNFISHAIVVVFFVVFILLEASFFRQKLEAAFDNRADRINQMGRDLMQQVTRYLTAKFYISLANGIIYAVTFYFIGLEFFILWGVFQFVMNFIPNLGSIVVGVTVSLFAIIQFWPEPTPIILVIVVVLVVNAVLSNILDPKIVGDHVGLSPLVVLVSLAFWGYLWGFAGMILSVPMMVIIKIICENIPILEPVSIFLGGKKSVLAKMQKTESQEQENQGDAQTQP